VIARNNTMRLWLVYRALRDRGLTIAAKRDCGLCIASDTDRLSDYYNIDSLIIFTSGNETILCILVLF